MLEALEQRTGRKGGGTVIVDRGMAFDENLQQIRARGHHYVVACRQSERVQWLDELEQEQGWQEVLRESSPTNPAQRKSQVWVKRLETAEHLYILCRSEGRQAKDRAIREKQEKRLLTDLGRLQTRIAKKRIVEAKVHEAIGRLKERYPRVARYYRLSFDPGAWGLLCQEEAEAKDRALRMDGAYLLKTDRKDLDTEEAWRIYILLTRVENAFRDLKSPLRERPIFHQLKNRVQTHIFLCVLAYHMLISIETSFLRKRYIPRGRPCANSSPPIKWSLWCCRRLVVNFSRSGKARVQRSSIRPSTTRSAFPTRSWPPSKPGCPTQNSDENQPWILTPQYFTA
jgi:transposase